MCNEYEELIRQAIDHEISQEDETKLVAHLEMCETCAEEYKALKSLQSCLKQLHEVELPEGFHQSLMLKVKEECQEALPQKNSKKSFPWHKGSMVAAALIIGCALFYQLEQTGIYSAKSDATENAADTTSFMKQSEASAEEAPSEVAESSIEERGVMANEQVANETIWQVHANEDIVGELTAYLEKNGLSYDLTDDQILIFEVTNQRVIYDWLISHGGEITENEGETKETLILQFDFY